jgi:hypothetical protein
MELICLCQEELPCKEDGKEIDKFIKAVSNVPFKTITGIDPSNGWSQPRPRRLVFYNFTYPEKAEKEFLSRLKPYCVGSLQAISKIWDIPIIGSALTKLTGISGVDMSDVVSDPQSEIDHRQIGIRLAIIGKREDGHMEDGTELL